MTDEAIGTENLSYTYGGLLAVDQISFIVTKGEILGYSGPNGAGLFVPTDSPMD